MTDHPPPAMVRPGAGRVPAATQVRPSRAADDGWGVLSYLITGIFLWGGLGWLADHLLGTGFLLPVGLVFGAWLALYTIWLRYGRAPGPERADAGTTSAPTSVARTTEPQEGRR